MYISSSEFAELGTTAQNTDRLKDFGILSSPFFEIFD